MKINKYILFDNKKCYSNLNKTHSTAIPGPKESPIINLY
jgi:hypothetical protein